MTTVTQFKPWTPDRYIVRENPEPGITSAIYDTLDPAYPAFYPIQPDPEHPERVILTNHKDQTQSMVPTAAQDKQAQALRFINDRFQVTEGGDGMHYTFSIEDRARRGPEGQVHSVANAWRHPRTGYYHTDFGAEPHPGRDWARRLISELNTALNGRPATSRAQTFAQNYLAAQPYPAAH